MADGEEEVHCHPSQDSPYPKSLEAVWVKGTIEMVGEQMTTPTKVVGV